MTSTCNIFANHFLMLPSVLKEKMGDTSPLVGERGKRTKVWRTALNLRFLYCALSSKVYFNGMGELEFSLFPSEELQWAFPKKGFTIKNRDSWLWGVGGMGSEKYRSSKVAPPSFHVLEEMFLVSIEGRKSPHLKDCYMDQQTVAQTPWPRTKWDCQYLTECPSESEVAQSCLILCNPMLCSLPGSSVHGIFQARVLEWVAISFSRGSFQPRD